VGKVFVVLSVLLVAILGYAFITDTNREWRPIQETYFKHEASTASSAAMRTAASKSPIQIYQLFPKVKVNDQYKVERCITCHVPDIQRIGPENAALALTRSGHPTHPKAIDNRIYARYGETAYAMANGQTIVLTDDKGKVIPDPTTGKPQPALPGFIPAAYKGMGIDDTGCIICHNGQRQATTTAGAHKNLIPDPFGTFDNAPALFQKNCAQCHGVQGQGGIGPPLNDQDRLGFFNDEYYHRCIYLGNTDPERAGTKMPKWGSLLKADEIELLTHWIRHWQNYAKLP
jgi:mono/diheme cytochrome c family protein